MHFASSTLAVLATSAIASGLVIDETLEDGVYLYYAKPQSSKFRRDEIEYEAPVKLNDIKRDITYEEPVRLDAGFTKRDDHITGEKVTELICFNSWSEPEALRGARIALEDECDGETIRKGGRGGSTVPEAFDSRREAVFVGKYGSNIAYMCSYRNRSNWCRKDEMKESFALLNEKCGQHQNGQLRIGGWNKAYGYATAFDVICHRAVGVDKMDAPEEYDYEYEYDSPTQW